MKNMLLILFLIFCNSIYSQILTPPAAGDGSSGNPYQIATIDNLYWLSQNSLEWSKYYVQTSDIDASSTSFWPGGSGFSPIGNSGTRFTGQYDGNGKTISNLYINRPASEYIGLFGSTANNAVIKNLFVTGTITGKDVVGGLVGEAGGNTIIENVCVNVSVTSGMADQWSDAGGLTGDNYSIIRNCSALGNVTAAGRNVGGLVGYNQDGKIYRSFAAGNVQTTHLTEGQVGGLVGTFLNAGSYIEDCYATGNATAKSNTPTTGQGEGVGGLVGCIRNAAARIVRSFSTGIPSATGGPVGGLVGENTVSAAVTGSFWDVTTSGKGTDGSTTGSAGGTGKSTINMKTQSTFTDASWDFTNTWDFKINNYPFIVPTPSTQSNGILFEDIALNQLKITWTSGSGIKRAVFVKENSGAIEIPVVNSSYTASSDWSSKGSQLGSSGYYCVYVGSGNTVTLTNVNADAVYYCYVFDFNDNILNLDRIRYITSGAANNPNNHTTPLPVELNSFTASVSNNKVLLAWSTATELNNYGFEIERASLGTTPGQDDTALGTTYGQDGNTPLNPLSNLPTGQAGLPTGQVGENEMGAWEKIGFVQGNGNSNSPKEYTFVDTNPIQGNAQYRLKQIDLDGNYKYYSQTAAVSFSPTDVNGTSLTGPKEFGLSQNYPNPFNPTTVISYQLPAAGNVVLKVYDMLGNEVSTLVNETKAPGYYAVEFNANDLAAGVYIYQLRTNNFVSSKKLLLLK